MKFVEGIKPGPEIFSHALGRLYYFGKASITWERVAEILARGQFPDDIRGSFGFVWEGEAGIVAAVDHVATYPLFFSAENISNVFYEVLNKVPTPTANECVKFEMQLLGGQTFLNTETTVKEIQRIPAGHKLFSGKISPFIDLLAYSGNEPLDSARLASIVEEEVSSMAGERNVLLLSGGTDSTTLAGIVKKLGLQEKFSFVHAYSGIQPLTESHIVEAIGREMNLEVKQARVDFSGDILPAIRGRQFSFWLENPFPAKRMAVERSAGSASRIFTGEIGDQVFGGPKNGALLNYALQARKVSAHDIAGLWINLSASYGKNFAIEPNARILDLFEDFPESRFVYEALREKIAATFSSMATKDYLNRVMLLNYVVKGPYRTWAYSQDELDWVHPFASWELFDYIFRVRSNEKVGPKGLSKSIQLNTWRPYLSELPWSIPKHGFGIPSLAKLRSAPQHLEH